MATVTTPATLNSVKSVFGGPNNLLAYLRGGSYVQPLPGAYPSVAAAAPLLLSAFAGRMKPTTYLTTMTDESSPPAGVTANAAVVVSSAGTISTGFTWLLQGSAADYDVYLLKTGGTNNLLGISQNTWYNLATTRTLYVQDTSGGAAVTWVGTMSIRFTASPQTTLNSASVSLTADFTPDTCPTCCFTPDTMVLMATGDWIQIVDVQKGDKLATRTGEKEVTEVITRTNRVMYQITFMDGRILNASEDHPLYVVDKGYAAINPGVGGEYKDLGIPDQLYVGDAVLDSDGRENAIVSIEPLDYPHTVYTFMESEFYANGMLVY